MTDERAPYLPPDALDRLTEALLDAGGVLSQIVADMARFEASGRSAPDAVPIPEAARTLVRDVLSDLGGRYSKRDLKMAARVVGDASAKIVSDVFFIDPAWLDEIESEET